jgi:hypothetical protein
MDEIKIMGHPVKKTTTPKHIRAKIHSIYRDVDEGWWSGQRSVKHMVYYQGRVEEDQGYMGSRGTHWR